MSTQHATLKQLRLFEAVARLGTYTQAARDLHLTQPAVSIQMKNLEGYVGLPLFEQTGKNLSVTEAGRVLLDHARTVLEEMESLQSAVDQLKGLRTGRLRISSVTTVNYFAPALLRTFCERYPGITVAMGVANRQELLGQLEENTIDMAIMGRPPVESGLVAEPFLDNPLVIVAPPDHPLARRKSIPLSILADHVFLMREPGSGTRSAMERYFGEKGIAITPSIEVSGAEALKQGVQAGLGLAMMSRDAVELEVASGRLVELKVAGLPIHRKWFLVHRQNKRLSPSAEAFKAFILEEARTLLGRAMGGRD